MIKKIFIVGFIFTLIVSLANQMDNENKIKEYEKEVSKLQTDKNNLKSDNEKLKEENEKLKEENELSSFTPIQRLFLEIDKDDNWYDVEEIIKKYPKLTYSHIRKPIKRKGNRTWIEYVQIAYEEDVVEGNLPASLRADYYNGEYTLKEDDVVEDYVIEGKEYITLDFSKDKNDKTYVSELSYYSKDFSIVFYDDMYNVNGESFISKSQLIDYLKNK